MAQRTVIEKATGMKASYHEGLANLLVKRGTHYFEGQPIELSVTDAKKFLEEKAAHLAKWEEELIQREAALATNDEPKKKGVNQRAQYEGIT